jgi:hypothetical protein
VKRGRLAQRLAGLEPDIICCGHAEPVTRNAAALLRTAARHPGHYPAHEEGSGG